MLGRVESDPSLTGLTPTSVQEGIERQFSSQPPSQKPLFLKLGLWASPNLYPCDLGKTPDPAPPTICLSPRLSSDPGAFLGYPCSWLRSQGCRVALAGVPV